MSRSRDRINRSAFLKLISLAHYISRVNTQLSLFFFDTLIVFYGKCSKDVLLDELHLKALQT